MANDLTVIEQQLTGMQPHFAQLLSPTRIAPERLIRTVMISVERTPKLLECNRQSIINAAMSAAVLGLEVDGYTGQAFLLPFKNVAQLVIGYKGYNTLAARAGYTINAGIVRQGDGFDYQLGTGGYVHHKPQLGNRADIIGAWAVASSPGRADIITPPLGIDELIAVKNKSPGARRSDSPWNDPNIGFPAMCEKTVKRRLARGMPLNTMQLAAALETHAEELGKPAYLDARGALVVNGQAQPLTPCQPEPEGKLVKDKTAFAVQLTGDNGSRSFDTIEQWETFMHKAMAQAPNLDLLDQFVKANNATMGQLHDDHGQAVERVLADYTERRKAFEGSGEGDENLFDEPDDADPMAERAAAE